MIRLFVVTPILVIGIHLLQGSDDPYRCGLTCLVGLDHLEHPGFIRPFDVQCKFVRRLD